MTAKRSPRGRKSRKPIVAWAVVHILTGEPLQVFFDYDNAVLWAEFHCIQGLKRIRKLVEAKPRKRKAGRKTK